MKNLVALFVVTALLSACKKDLSICKDYKEITGREDKFKPTDVPIQQIRDTLLKYPQLEVVQLNTNNISTQVMCNVYYQNLPVFSEYYSMFKNGMADTISVSGAILTTSLAVSLNPSVKHEEAIKEARNFINLDHTCTAYQLGLYNKNRWQLKAPNYRLAWKISDLQNPYLYVIIDAVDKSYLYAEGGNRYWVD